MAHPFSSTSGLALEAYSEIVYVEALHKRFRWWLRVFVDIHAGSHTVVLGDGARVEVLHHFPRIQISTADLHMQQHHDNSGV